MADNRGPLSPPGEAARPTRTSLHGKYTSVVPIDSSHAESLRQEIAGVEDDTIWTFLSIDRPATEEEFTRTIEQWTESRDPLHFAVYSAPVTEEHAKPLGAMTYLNINPENRRIEIGYIVLGSRLKRTRQATEAFYLLMNHAFEGLNYLRLEWKANHLNKPSVAAAERLGFTYEGTFRKHMIVKGRRRDTAWLSITNDEWPAIKAGFQSWLHADNFDEQGKQRRTLKQCRENPE